MLRHFTTLGMGRWLGPSFPYSTLLINVTGSFAIGAITTLGLERAALSETSRIALTVGFLGGFTTFSSFALETVKLAEGGQAWFAIINIIASVVLCVGAAAFGIFIAR